MCIYIYITHIYIQHLTVQKCEGEIEHVRQEKAALELLAEELKVLKPQHASVCKDLEEAKAALLKQELQAGKLTGSLEERMGALTTENSEHKVSLARSSEENKLQMQEVCQLRAVNEATKKEIDRCVSEQTAGGDRMLQRIQELSAKSDDSQAQVVSLQETIQQLHTTLQQLHIAKADVQTAKAELMHELKDTQRDLAQINEAALKMEAALELKQAEVLQDQVLKQAEVLALTEARQAVHDDLVEAKHKSFQLQQDLQDACSKLAHLEKEHMACECIGDLKEALHAAHKQVQELELELSKMSSKCELLEEERAGTKRMLESKDSSGAQVMATVSKLSDQLQEARADAATLQVRLDQAVKKSADKDEVMVSLEAAGIEMEAALTIKCSQAEELTQKLQVALDDKQAVMAVQLKLDAALEHTTETDKQLAAALLHNQATATTVGTMEEELELAQQEAQRLGGEAEQLRTEALELRAASGAQTNVIIESCEKRMKMLEYDLVSKCEEQKKLEKVSPPSHSQPL